MGEHVAFDTGNPAAETLGFSRTELLNSNVVKGRLPFVP